MQRKAQAKRATQARKAVPQRKAAAQARVPQRAVPVNRRLRAAQANPHPKEAQAKAQRKAILPAQPRAADYSVR